MSLSLVLPPLTQLNTPYPSISYLANYFRDQGVECEQRDLGIELVLRVFSRSGLSEVFAELAQRESLPEPAWRALSLQDHHISAIEPVIAFLQGKEHTLATRILETSFLPLGPRSAAARLDSFGLMGSGDAARHMATLYLADLADLITSCIDEGFGLARYQAHLATSAEDFGPIWQRLSETTLIDTYLDELGETIDSEVVALSVPFPGNLYGALRLGRAIKARGSYVVLGGGYVNTELRDLKEERIWNCVDAVTYDDGEGPLHAIVDHVRGSSSGKADWRHRTRTQGGTHNAKVSRPPPTFAAHYGQLDLSLYLQTIDTLNPAHRLWADGRWNKITLAHGCYWKRCTFCDVNLDYIGHYEAAPIIALVDQMERLIEETGERGFHFVDEAAPPKLLRALAIEILKRGLQVTFWGNIRFEKSYDEDLCRLLAAAGLIAVTGGLEVANDRLLERIDKGVTVEQVARASREFRNAGVMVHAYLMYGFPTQTEQETIDSMELVRQLFEHKLIQSAFWHRFVLTRHAPIFERPADYGVQIVALKSGATAFAQNDVPHLDAEGGDHSLFDEVLPAALEQWLQGNDIERPVESWFPRAMPASEEAPDRITQSLEMQGRRKERGRLLWLGGEALEGEGELTLHTVDAEVSIRGSDDEIAWLAELLGMAAPQQEAVDATDAKDAFPGNWREFEPSWQILRELGLLIL
jgi:hypothetical protein